MLKGLKNDNGVVFVTVIVIIITMMVLVITIIGLNVSQTSLTEREVRRIKSEQLALGALAYVYANQMSPSPGNDIDLSFTLDDVDYSIVMNIGTTTPSYDNSSSSKELTIEVTR